MRILLSCALIFTSQLAFGYTPKQLTLINKCDKETRVAIASWVPSIGRFYWAIEGWIVLAPGETKTRRVSASRNPYIRVQVNQKALTPNDASFCVSRKAFSARQYNDGPQRFIMGAEGVQSKGDNCDSVGGYISGGFQRLDFEGKYTNINYNIRCS